MGLINQISVGFVSIPLKGHETRGSGVYYNNLKSELLKIKEISLTEIDVSAPYVGFDIIHFPYFDPYFITLPLLGRTLTAKTVVTVHDLIPLKYPAKFPSGLRGLFKWQMQKNSLGRASAIVTDSYDWKNQIAKITNINLNKIEVIPLGVSQEFKKIKDRSLIDKVTSKFNIPSEFILYVGDVNYNKNILNLLVSFLTLSLKYQKLKLILVGSGFITNTKELLEIEDFIRKKNIEDKVIKLASLTNLELCVLYNLAKVFLLPSIDEGFGLPILEAFASQTPVVASNIGSIEEIAKNAAFLINPNNPHEIAGAVNQLIEDKELRQKLIANGLEKIKLFTWQKTALQTVDLYKNTLGIKEYKI